MAIDRKQVMIVGGALLVLLLLYRHYASAAPQQAGTQTGGSDPSAASNYAALAGQTQSDEAALQAQNQQLSATEQSDVQNLSGELQQFESDFATYQQGQTTWQQGQTSANDALAAQAAAALKAAQDAGAWAVHNVGSLTTTVNSVASGEQATSRATTITTKKGGAFYDWYKSIFNRPPPTVVNNANPIYLAWQHGVSKAQVKKHNPKGILS